MTASEDSEDGPCHCGEYVPLNEDGFCKSCMAHADPCPDCQGRGWLHMNEDDGGGEIQACDCGAIQSDEDAAAAHRKACQCGIDAKSSAVIAPS